MMKKIMLVLVALTFIFAWLPGGIFIRLSGPDVVYADSKSDNHSDQSSEAHQRKIKRNSLRVHWADENADLAAHQADELEDLGSDASKAERKALRRHQKEERKALRNHQKAERRALHD